MTRRLLIVAVAQGLLALVCASCTDGKAGSEAPLAPVRARGNEIVNEYLKRDASPFRRSTVSIVVTEPGGPGKRYVFESIRRQQGGETRTLTRAIEPPDERELAILTIEVTGQPAVTVTYVASQKRFRESGTGRTFLGGLTSQELLGEWDKYESRFVAERAVGGRTMHEVESVLKKDRDSVIHRIVSLFDAGTGLPRQLELFDSRGEKLRTFDMLETRRIGGRDVITKTVVENHVQRTRIAFDLIDMTFPADIPSEVFDRTYLQHLGR